MEINRDIERESISCIKNRDEKIIHLFGRV
jgi:hypothetical protein